ncbi:MAG: pilin [Patescibacteria group bacterium]|nr:MAG: pilin [Patescibacteria group bacterium]
MRLKRILLPALCLVAVMLVALPDVYAQFGLDAAAPSSLKGNKDLLATIGRLIQTVLSYLGVLFLILMLYSGFLYMTARGDDKKIDTAKKIISGAVTGLIIIAASYALTAFVINAVAGTASSGSASDPNGPTPITVDTNECTTRTCTTASDCSVPGNYCYTGTCECLGEGDPSIGSEAQPCSFGLCAEAS